MPAEAQSPQLYLGPPVEGLAVVGTKLFWKAKCDRGHPSSYIRAVEATIPTGGGNALGGGLLGKTLFKTPTCWPDSVGSRNLAADSHYVYYIDRYPRLVRIAHGEAAGSSPSPVRLTQVQPATGVGFVLALSPGWVAWTNGEAVFRVQSGVGPGFAVIYPLVDPGDLPPIFDLLPSGGDYIVWARDGLHRLAAPHFNLDRLSGTDATTAFTVDGADVYAAVRTESGSYTIAKVGSDGAFLPIYTQTASGESELVDYILVADGMIFWHVSGEAGGPIMRMSLSRGAPAGRPVPITGDIALSPETRLSASAGWLLWTSAEDHRLYRLPLTAAPRPQ
jgi:hypothetical protein